MSDVERVRAMLAAGTITKEEAEELIEALTSLDDLDQAGDPGGDPQDGTGVPAADAPVSSGAPEAPNVSASPDAPALPDVPPSPGASPSPDAPASPIVSPVRPVPPVQSVPPVPPVPPAPPVRVEPTVSDDADPWPESSKDRRWLRVELLAGELDVVVDETITKPIVDGKHVDLVLRENRRGMVLKLNSPDRKSRWMLGMMRVEAKVRLPLGWGVDLDVKAGEVSLSGVPYVRGRMLAGDLNIEGASAVDIDKLAGDLDVDFKPTEGFHRIASRAGDVKVRLLPGSDVRLEGKLTVGEITAEGFEHRSQGVGSSVRGVLGQGKADLKISLTAGDLRIVRPGTGD